MGGLYPSPSRRYGRVSYKPRYYSLSDTTKGYDAHNRSEVTTFAREAFASSPNLNGAVREKANFIVQDAFLPRFRGSNTAWGDAVEVWLKNRVFPVVNVRGGNYDFLNTLLAISIALDIDGDCLLYLAQSRNGFPMVGVLPSHRIGSRNASDLVKDGRYKGNKIQDGVILNPDARPIAYRVLGDTPEDDYDISAQSAMLLFETQWLDSNRGISNCAPCLLECINVADIDSNLQLGVKSASSINVLAYSNEGLIDDSNLTSPILGEDANALPQAPITTSTNSGLSVQPMFGGMINYLSTDEGEKLEAFKSDMPTANIEAFVSRLERRIMESIGWPYELLNSKDAGGAAVRLVQQQARIAIRSRQNTLTRASKFIVAYCVAQGMKQGLIPQNYNDEWFNWQFNYGELLTVDNGYEAEANRKDLLLGLTTLEEVTAKKGKDWVEVREQITKETEDLLTRAKDLSTRYAIPMAQALDLLSQRTPNGVPVTIKEDSNDTASN
jgi:capsid protein